jgi:hypothetical protein
MAVRRVELTAKTRLSGLRAPVLRRWGGPSKDARAERSAAGLALSRDVRLGSGCPAERMRGLEVMLMGRTVL